MWQMSVFSHEGAQRNDAGNLVYENVFKTTLVAKWPCWFKGIFIYIYIYEQIYSNTTWQNHIEYVHELS